MRQRTAECGRERQRTAEYGSRRRFDGNRKHEEVGIARHHNRPESRSNGVDVPDGPGGDPAMSATITVEEAQAHLKELIGKLAPGEELVITDNERPVAKLVATRPAERKLGTMKGSVRYMAPDLDAPPDDFKEYME